MSRYVCILATAAVVLVAPSLTRASIGVYQLRDDPTGGHCTLIGIWDAGTRTCTLTTDVSDVPVDGTWGAIELASSDITLDGAGHAIVGLGSAAGRWGIAATGSAGPITGLTIRNIRISDFGGAIVLQYNAAGALIEHSEFVNAGGIQIEGASSLPTTDVRITDNQFVNTSIYLDTVQRFAVQRNHISASYIQVEGSADGIVSDNAATLARGFVFFVWVDRTIVRDNLIEGDLNAPPPEPLGQSCVLGNDNQFFHNNYINMPRPRVDEMSVGNVFSLPAPIGGNYWSDHPCSDANSDAFCDAPVVMTGAIDELPQTIRGGWKDFDGDGWSLALDCNDADATVFPGASEVKHDGVDQDCNGYDLTIDILKAHYTVADSSLRVEAVSNLAASAALVLDSIGPMVWRKNGADWAFSLAGTTNPGEVTVCGIEGCTVAPVLSQ